MQSWIRPALLPKSLEMGVFSENVTANVAFLGDRAREMAADESDRSKVLDTKAAGVVAASVALTAAGASFAARLSELEGGSGARLLWTVELGSALFFLLLAGGLAVWALAPKAVRTAVHIDELRRWDTPRVLEDDPTRVAGSLLRASVHSVGHARTVNNVKAGRLRWASIGLGAGLASIVALAVSLAAHAIERV